MYKIFIFNYFLEVFQSSSSSIANMDPKIDDTSNTKAVSDTRIECGKLRFEKKWYG